MFKGTNKVWKGLALALALCMLPTAAFADGETGQTTISVSIESATYNDTASPATVSVTAKTGALGKDVTILAYRSGEKVELGATNPVIPDVESDDPDAITLADSVVYIDQETTNDTTGEFTFTFIPRNLEKTIGKYINIYVGGEDLSDGQGPAFVQLTAAEPAPALGVPTKLYKGENLEIDVTKTASGSAYNAVEAWYNDIKSVTVDTTLLTEGTDYALNEAKTALVIKNQDVLADGVISIAIEGTMYANPEAWSGNLTCDFKPAGEFRNVPAKIVAGETVGIEVTNDDATYGEAWIEALTARATVTLGDAVVAVNGYDEDGKLNITADFAADGKAENEGVTAKLVIALDEYAETKSTDITVVPPTVQAAEELVIPAAGYKAEPTDADFYTPSGDDTYPDDPTLKNQKYGRIYLDVSTIATANYGTSVEWSVAPKAGGDALTAFEGVYDLTRSEEGPVVYTVTATVKKGEYIDGIKTKDITVGQIGVAGVNVTANLKGGAAKGATLKIMNGDAEVAEMEATETWEVDRADARLWTFAAANVTAGEYTLVVSRPGFATEKISITVADTDLNVTPETPIALKFGDNANPRGTEQDGKIETTDFDNLCAEFDMFGSGADLKFDVNGDGVVETTDFDALCGNFDYTASWVE